MGEVIVITSGKGGVGKTTTVANIGTGLAMMGKKTVVVDTDIGLRNLDVVLGLENRIVYNLVDVVEGKLPAEAGPDQRQAAYRSSFCTAVCADERINPPYHPEQMIKLIG